MNITCVRWISCSKRLILTQAARGADLCKHLVGSYITLQRINKLLKVSLHAVLQTLPVSWIANTAQGTVCSITFFYITLRRVTTRREDLGTGTSLFDKLIDVREDGGIAPSILNPGTR